MLTGVSNQQHLILRGNLIEEVAYLLRRCQRRFIDHIKMLARRIAGGLQAAACEEALQRVRLDTHVAKLLRGTRSRRKTFHDVAALFGSLTYGFEHRSFARSGPPLQSLY